jgi:hypothetical protein
MKIHRRAGAAVAWLLTAVCSVELALASDDPSANAVGEAPLFRVFLRDGTSLVSYGEIARLDDRVVFSMPTAASMDAPQLHLVSLGSDRVDWERTTAYAEAARAARYLATRAETDYAVLTDAVAQALNDVGLTDDLSKRLAIVERARRTLADWPRRHYGYRQGDVQQMLGMLDEAIAELRAANGIKQFDLSFVAATQPLQLDRLLPPPTPKEAIEQTLTAARLTESAAERTSLLTVAIVALERDARALPAEFVAATRAAAQAMLKRELEIDRTYQSLTSRMMARAQVRAAAADVRGIERLIEDIRAADVELGSARPDSVVGLIAAVEERLDAARRLRLERDRWALRQADFRAYRSSINLSLLRLTRIRQALEDIKSLAGSGPDALASVERVALQILRAVSAIAPPEEFKAAHALIGSAAQLAESAARIRREAVLTSSMARAWDASSAAAGALMLAARAQSDIQSMLRLPRLSQ